MRYRDKKKLQDSEWNKRVPDLPFEDQVEHGSSKELNESGQGDEKMTEFSKQRFRKKPIEIDAYQLTKQKEIKTREGTLMGYPGDWVVTGIQGEIYPVGKEIFEMTYDPVDCTSHNSQFEQSDRGMVLLDKLEKWLYEEGIKFEKKCDSEENYTEAVSACARRAQCYYTIEKLKEFRKMGWKR
jgi:hypothetical protein